jgi:uroporphyrinogen-III synthase
VIKPLVLVTRPKPEADATATRVAALGYRTLIEPLIEIVPRLGRRSSWAIFQAVLVTSGNGARALAAHTPVRDQWLFTVGDATAKALRELGFLRVESARGSATELAELVQRRCDPSRGSLLHVRGDVVASDPSVSLSEAVFRCAPPFCTKPEHRPRSVHPSNVRCDTTTWHMCCFSQRAQLARLLGWRWRPGLRLLAKEPKPSV